MHVSTCETPCDIYSDNPSQIPDTQNHEQNKMVVLCHYVLGLFTMQQEYQEIN